MCPIRGLAKEDPSFKALCVVLGYVTVGGFVRHVGVRAARGLGREIHPQRFPGIEQVSGDGTVLPPMNPTDARSRFEYLLDKTPNDHNGLCAQESSRTDVMPSPLRNARGSSLDSSRS
jgi:hypothetical protein